MSIVPVLARAKAEYNYEWITPKPLDAMTLYGIPIAGVATGLIVGAPVGYFIKRRRTTIKQPDQ